MCKIPLNTEPSGAFHCPVHHYSMCTYNEILPGFKERCDKQSGVLVVYELQSIGMRDMNLPINTTADGAAFAVTVSMPNNAQLCNIINGGGIIPQQE